MTTLAAKALDLADRHALDAKSGKGVLDVVELEWLHDGGYQFHGEFPLSTSPSFRS